MAAKTSSSQPDIDHVRVAPLVGRELSSDLATRRVRASSDPWFEASSSRVAHTITDGRLRSRATMSRTCE